MKKILLILGLILAINVYSGQPDPNPNNFTPTTWAELEGTFTLDETEAAYKNSIAEERKGFELPWFFAPGKAGCTDPKASNWDPEATTDNGTCIYLATE